MALCDIRDHLLNKVYIYNNMASFLAELISPIFRDYSATTYHCYKLDKSFEVLWIDTYSAPQNKCCNPHSGTEEFVLKCSLLQMKDIFLLVDSRRGFRGLLNADKSMQKAEKSTLKVSETFFCLKMETPSKISNCMAGAILDLLTGFQFLIPRVYNLAIYYIMNSC